MLLAHGGGGSVAEALILALPLVVLGVVLFVQKTAKPIVSVVLVVTGIAVAVGGVTVFAEDDHETGTPVPAGNGSYVSTVTGLCEANRLAGSDPERAAEVFEDEVHVPLHDLAAEVGESDRAAASELLEAKVKVESDLQEEPVDGERLEADLTELLEASAAALVVIGAQAPTC